MERVKVEFETITPLWTGDAWGECKEIRPSSIMGSLRFWFEVYCHFAGIDVSYEKENLDYKWFKEELKSRVRERFDVDVEKIALDVARERLTLPSLIFGCTGWRSRVEIESIKFQKRTIKDSEFDYNYLHNENSNTEWWTKKVLFNNRRQIDVFENIELELKVDTNILNDIKEFFKFYDNNPVLVGGKKAFGLGFVKLKSDLNLNDINIEIKKDNVVIWDSVKVGKNNITGYNVKYFLRKEEKDKNLRVKNFGKIGQASNFYFSMPRGGIIYMISFENENFENENNENKEILDKYKKNIEKTQYSKTKKHNTKKVSKLDINNLKNKWDSR